MRLGVFLDLGFEDLEACQLLATRSLVTLRLGSFPIYPRGCATPEEALSLLEAFGERIVAVVRAERSRFEEGLAG